MSWCLVLLRMRWKQLWSEITVGSTLVLSALSVCATQAGMTHQASLTPRVSFGTRLRHAHMLVSRARRTNSNQQSRACANLVNPEQVLERQARHVNRRAAQPPPTPSSPTISIPVLEPYLEETSKPPTISSPNIELGTTSSTVNIMGDFFVIFIVTMPYSRSEFDAQAHSKGTRPPLPAWPRLVLTMSR